MPQVLVNGLLLGSNYALLAIGYTLVFGVTRLLTLAHGEVFMVAGVLAVLGMKALGLPLVLAVLLALLVGTAAGLATDLLCFRPVGRASHLAPAVATIGFALVLQNTVLVLRGSSNPVGLPAGLKAPDLHVGPVLVSSAQLAMLMLALVLMAATQWFIRRTRWGAAMRAMGESPETVELLGINAKALGTITLAVSGLLAGVASVLVALRIGSVSPFAGIQVGLKGLAIMTVAGMGSVTGAVVVGLGVGVAEVLAGFYGFGGFERAIPWILVVLVLLLRPGGLFGARTR